MTFRVLRDFRGKLLIAVATAALSACSHGPQSPRPAVEAGAASVGNAQQYDQVIDSLKHGDTKAASKKLKGMLKHNPNDTRARLLKETIDIDPVAMLGSASFAYTIKPNDTLFDLAGQYLGDSDKFYALARYNKIAVPNAIQAGQSIRIPGAAPVEQAPPERHVTRPASPAPKAAPAKPAPAPAKPAPSVAPHVDPARAAKYRAVGLGALNRGDVNHAVAYLSRAARLDPDNAVIAHDLARARRIQRTVNARK